MDGAPFHQQDTSSPSTVPVQSILIGHPIRCSPSNPYQKFQRIDDSTARGPGIIDMKGGDDHSHSPRAEGCGALDKMNVTVVFDGDEEEAGTPTSAARQTLVDAAQGAAAALGFEDGAGDPRTAVISRRSAGSWTLTTTGIPAHSSQIFKPEFGAAAVFEASRILHEFYTRLSAEPYLTFNPGLALGGTLVKVDTTGTEGSASGKRNVSAEHMVVTGDLRSAVARARQGPAPCARDRVASLAQDPGRDLVRRRLPAHGADAGHRRLLAITTRPAATSALAASWQWIRRAGAADVSFIASTVPMLIDALGLSGHDDHTEKETATSASCRRRRSAPPFDVPPHTKPGSPVVNQGMWNPRSAPVSILQMTEGSLRRQSCSVAPVPATTARSACSLTVTSEPSRRRLSACSAPATSRRRRTGDFHSIPSRARQLSWRILAQDLSRAHRHEPVDQRVAQPAPVASSIRQPRRCEFSRRRTTGPRRAAHLGPDGDVDASELNELVRRRVPTRRKHRAVVVLVVSRLLNPRDRRKSRCARRHRVVSLIAGDERAAGATRAVCPQRRCTPGEDPMTHPEFDESTAARVRAAAPERFDDGFTDRVLARIRAPRETSLGTALERQFLRIVPLAAAATLLLAAYNLWGAREASVPPLDAALNLPQVTLSSAYSATSLYGVANAPAESYPRHDRQREVCCAPRRGARRRLHIRLFADATSCAVDASAWRAATAPGFVAHGGDHQAARRCGEFDSPILEGVAAKNSKIVASRQHLKVMLDSMSVALAPMLDAAQIG